MRTDSTLILENMSGRLISHIFSYYQKLADLEARLVSLDSGDTDVVRSTIEEFSEKVNLDQDSILNK